MKILFIFMVSVFIGRNKADDVDPVVKEIEESITAELYGPLDRVLVCLNQDARNQLISRQADFRPYLYFEFPNINIEYHNDDSSCHYEIEKDEQQTRTIIAVVAPKPFKLSSEVPMYFYDIPYLMDDDTDAFPNGLAPLQIHWEWLKHVFIHHITSNGWKRIAVVSDYSEPSQKFEKVLVKQFQENKFAYNVQRCVTNTTVDCNFDSALNFLQTQKTVIIIANVEGENAQKLVNAARALNMQSAQYVWLVRDWPFQDTRAQIFERVLSMSLSPNSSMPKYRVNNQEYHDGPHFNSIWRGLQLISEAVHETEKKERISEYYKSITQKMNKTHYSEGYLYKGYIRKCSDGNPKIIKKLLINETGVTSVLGPRHGPVYKIDDWKERCMLRSNSFTSPCDDNWIMLICVVWLMFILMMFMLIFFFNRCLVWT